MLLLIPLLPFLGFLFNTAFRHQVSKTVSGGVATGAMGLAFGVAVPLGARAAFRFEARGYLTVVDADSAIFCRSDNGTGFCRVIASGSTVVQAEALAGIAIRF